MYGMGGWNKILTTDHLMSGVGEWFVFFLEFLCTFEIIS